MARLEFKLWNCYLSFLLKMRMFWLAYPMLERGQNKEKHLNSNMEKYDVTHKV